ncbi:VOC family protein [Tritonibacter horizontis]|uniref:VOC domain-containing protein n=1 Tax=Tritonibacter horizontis TaxID=1768241 RepID=A0A132BXV8_9RHOB|nr:VOC family protein [Tritonibacter horizontis]KUP93239.1 hypothetical protein TRIHO_18950 [Tritonibacter horizontis]
MPASWKPNNYPSVSPYLVCHDPEGTIAFLQRAFDATLLRRHNRDDGSLMHAELRIDDSVVMIGGLPEAADCDAHVHLYVPDAQLAFDQAIAAGGMIVQEPMRKRPDDDLRGGIKEPSGSTWWLATQPAQVPA